MFPDESQSEENSIDNAEEEKVQGESEQEEDAPEANENDDGSDYDKVKEHMHMVLARYAKEGIIDYKEAAQIHDVMIKVINS